MKKKNIAGLLALLIGCEMGNKIEENNFGDLTNDSNEKSLLETYEDIGITRETFSEIFKNGNSVDRSNVARFVYSEKLEDHYELIEKVLTDDEIDLWRKQILAHKILVDHRQKLYPAVHKVFSKPDSKKNLDAYLLKIRLTDHLNIGKQPFDVKEFDEYTSKFALENRLTHYSKDSVEKVIRNKFESLYGYVENIILGKTEGRENEFQKEFFLNLRKHTIFLALKYGNTRFYEEIKAVQNNPEENESLKKTIETTIERYNRTDYKDF